jgi:hypothetical protein
VLIGSTQPLTHGQSSSGCIRWWRFSRYGIGDGGLDKISDFIDEQKDVVYESSVFHGLKADKIAPFDARIDELKGLIENKRRKVKTENRRRSFRFWVPVSISILALVVSIVSLLITWSNK